MNQIICPLSLLLLNFTAVDVLNVQQLSSPDFQTRESYQRQLEHIFVNENNYEFMGWDYFLYLTIYYSQYKDKVPEFSRRRAFLIQAYHYCDFHKLYEFGYPWADVIPPPKFINLKLIYINISPTLSAPPLSLNLSYIPDDDGQFNDCDPVVKYYWDLTYRGLIEYIRFYCFDDNVTWMWNLKRYPEGANLHLYYCSHRLTTKYFVAIARHYGASKFDIVNWLIKGIEAEKEYRKVQNLNHISD
jgi:hypothetical protein